MDHLNIEVADEGTIETIVDEQNELVELFQMTWVRYRVPTRPLTLRAFLVSKEEIVK